MNKENNSSREEFAKSQFKSGQLFEKQGKYAEAVKAYKKIKREDDNYTFAASRFYLGKLFEKQEKYAEAVKTYKEIEREDDDYLFAVSQFYLGQLFEKQGKYAEAVKAYKKIEREDDDYFFAASRFNLGLLFYKQENYVEAELAYGLIQREYDKKLFAMSRFNLGLLFEAQEKYERAQHAYKEIEREDDKKYFAMSRFNLGVLFELQEKKLEAEKAYQEIKREDDKKYFAMSRFNLGLLFEKQEKYEETERAYKEIERRDNKKYFAMSRFNLGVFFESQGKKLEAEKAYQEIKREDNKKYFAMSQNNLGVLFDLQGKYLEAEEAYKKIKRKDNKEIFAISRFNFGRLLEDQEKYSEANRIYKRIKMEDHKQSFVKSRNNLGVLLVKQGKYKKAEEAFRDLIRSGYKETFALACTNLGSLLKQENKLVEAKEILENITEKDGEYFFKARFIIGEINLKEGLFDRAKIAFEKSKEIYYYSSECFILILELSNLELTKSLINIKESVDVILNNLILDKHEEYISHYTRPSTVFSLLGYNGDASKLRLSTIKNVNDPTEGNILFDYFDLPNREVGLGSFISCFTFNHDSLNQFRLYGKEDNQEASGVSVVFKKGFFGRYSNNYNFIEYGKKERVINLSSLERDFNINKSVKDEINKLPVYRCIYMDNKYDYIKLAKRSEIEFYREEKSKYFTSYLNDINKKTENVRLEIENIKKILNLVLKNNKNNDGLYSVINYILLPLKFLVKHAAFEDEQECRIFFITNLFDERIISNINHKSMYLEYEPPVREYIDKIYLSNGASQYEDFFIRSLRDSSKVCRSRNPFRNK